MVGAPQATAVVYFALLAAVGLQRLAELRLSRRNSRQALAAGAVEVGSRHYPWMVGLHSAFLPSCLLEVWLLERPLLPPLAAAALAVLAVASALRYWTIRSLGERWTTRVYSWPRRSLVRAGPYRLLRHPNYLAVVLEIAALPLVHSAWLSAAIFTVLNAVMLAVRIPVENAVLAAAEHHRLDQRPDPSVSATEGGPAG